MLDPGCNLARITVKRRKPNKWFKHDRRALDVLSHGAHDGHGATRCHPLGIADASEEDVQSVALGIQHGLKNHEGKGVQRTNEGSPARWRLKEAAN